MGDNVCGQCDALFTAAHALLDNNVRDEPTILGTLAFAWSNSVWAAGADDYGGLELLSGVDGMPLLRLPRIAASVITYDGSSIAKAAKINVYSRDVKPQELAEHYERLLKDHGIHFDKCSAGSVSWDIEDANLTLTVRAFKEQRTVASLAVSAFVASCSLVLSLSWEVLGEPRPTRAQTTGTCPNAQLIDTFEGNGNQQTDTFDTTTNSLRVTYNVTGSDPDLPAFLGIIIIDANDPDQLSVGSATQEGNGRGETFVNTPAGTYFLDITLFFSGQYTITVEQCEGGNPSRNPGGRAAPVRDQYASKTLPPRTPPGDVSNPRDVIPGTGIRRVPATGGPPYLAVGVLALLGMALIVGRGVLKR